MKVFIAEDDVVSRTLLRGMLQKWGFDPVAVADGAEAWEALGRADAPRLVLLDWTMPGMSGLEITRRLRAADAAIAPYVILVTAKGEKENVIEGLDAGANDYVTKPFDPEILRARVNVGRRMVELQTSLTEALARLEHEATHDSLTGILNRRAIAGALTRELSRCRREKGGLAIAICDIDQFKAINDSKGHLAGDEVIRGFVGRLEGALREYDSLGRWGGDEFLVISPGVGKEEALHLYERLRTSIAEAPIPAGGLGLRVTTSIGLALFSGTESEDELIAAADTAMYRAKTAGRDRVCMLPEA